MSAKVDYALRAVIELAASADGPVKGERIAQAQEIPLKFLENILNCCLNARDIGDCVAHRSCARDIALREHDRWRWSTVRTART